MAHAVLTAFQTLKYGEHYTATALTSAGRQPCSVQMYSSSVQSCASIEVLSRVVEARLSRCQDANALLYVAFNGVGGLSRASVEAARARALPVVQQSRPCQSAPAGVGTSGNASGTLSTSSGSSNSGSIRPLTKGK